jgi:hypothetical protein
VLAALERSVEPRRGVPLLGEGPPAERVLFQSFLPPDATRRQWAATDGRWRAVWGSDGAARLFDHAQDPREERDLAGEHPAIAARFKDGYEAALRGAAESSLQGVDVEMDEAALRELQALGYAEVAPGGKQ